MKTLILNVILLFSAIVLFGGCDKTGNFPGAEVNPDIAIYDLRSFYKNTDYALTTKSMLGATGITGIVVSDHRGNNLSAGLLMVQDRSRLKELRGLAINIGPAAAQYIPGDSVRVTLTGGVMKRVDGLLQVTGLDGSVVTKIASGKAIPLNQVPSRDLLKNPDKYESTELAIVKVGFDPIPAPADTYAGDRLANDGFGDFILHTDASATFAGTPLLPMASFFGVIEYGKTADGKYVPQFHIRKPDDIKSLGYQIVKAAVVISGFMADVEGTPDPDGEYIQFLATRDIDFSVTPFSVVTHNTNSAYQPLGVPLNGWATGGKRSYKWDLKSGKVNKGDYFYVGNSVKLINGVGSTPIDSAKWIVSRNSSAVAGDGFGDKNPDLLLNGVSLYSDGIAVFEGTTVTSTSIPIDVIISGYNGSIFNAAQKAGLRITNTDWYDTVNPITFAEQPFYKQGTNTICLLRGAPTDSGWFNKLSGEYNVRLGRWTTARSQNTVDLSKTSKLDELEKEFPKANGTTPGVVPTKVVE